MIDISKLGSRIVIYGATGSGKTTLSRRLGRALSLKVIEMDAMRHDGGWDATPWDDFALRVAGALADAEGAWVCDGNYSRVADLVLAQADTVIWLHLSWRVSFWRLLGRTLQRSIRGERLYSENGPRESLRQAFLSRSSILWWSIHHHRTYLRNTSQRLAQAGDDITIFDLRSAEEVARLLIQVDRMLETLAGPVRASEPP